MTVLTDYLLGGVAAWLGWKLLRNSEVSRRWWGAAFVALALGAFLGGTWHGFFQDYWLWKATVLAIGAASFAMLARAIFLWDRPIPIVFHWVLAAFVISVGHSHRQRLKS